MIELLMMASMEIGTQTLDRPVRIMACDTQDSIQYEADRPKAPMSRPDCRTVVLIPGQEYTNLTWLDAAGGNEFLLAVTDVGDETVFIIRAYRKKEGLDA